MNTKRWLMPSIYLSRIRRREEVRPPRLERVLLRPIRALTGQVSLAWHAAYFLRRHLHHHETAGLATPPAVPVPAPSQSTLKLLRERIIERHLHFAHRQDRFHSRDNLVPAPAQIQRVPAPRSLSLTLRQTAYPHITTVLAQAANARADTARDSASRETAPAVAWSQHTARGNEAQVSQPWTLPLQELTRITQSVSSQVINQLERRALSFRERSGRL